MYSLGQYKLYLIGFVMVIILIPAFSVILSQRFKAASSGAQSYNTTVTNPTSTEVPGNSPFQDLLKDLASSSGQTASDSAGIQQTLGPGLNFSVTMEGRPANKQAGRFFVGIGVGKPANTPQYLVQFTVDVPDSGSYDGISLTGLIQGKIYTAYIKGPAQLVKAVPFVMNPQGVTLNSGNPIDLTTGDLNQDNVVDNADYNIALGLVGKTPNSTGWNPTADFNLDSVINNLDLSIILKHLNEVGDSGPWYSQVSTASASLVPETPSIGGEPITPVGGGHWIWIPDLSQ